MNPNGLTDEQIAAPEASARADRIDELEAKLLDANSRMYDMRKRVELLEAENRELHKERNKVFRELLSMLKEKVTDDT